MSLCTVRPLVFAAAALLTALSAQAEVLVSGHVGVVGGGNSHDGQVGYGGAITFAPAFPLAFEVEGQRTPDLLGDGDFVGNTYFPENDVRSLTAHILIGPRVGQRGRVYASLGGGWSKTRANFSPSDGSFEYRDSDFGLSAGAGALGFFYGRLGMRGDLRYFHALGDDQSRVVLETDIGKVRFWRGTAGLIFAF